MTRRMTLSVAHRGFRHIFFGLVSLCVSLVRAQSIDLEMIDRDSGEGARARIRFTKGDKGAGVPKRLLTQGKWVLAEPTFSISPKPGEYEFLVQRGHEFTDVRGGFTMEKRAKDVVTVKVPRSTDMRQEHWYSGDHDCNLSPDLLARWQLADAIDLVVAVSNQESVAHAETPTRSTVNPKKKKEEEVLELSTDAHVVGLQLMTSAHRLHNEYGCVFLHSWNKGTSFPNDGSLQSLFTILESQDQREWVPELGTIWSRDVPLLLSTNGLRAVQVLNASQMPEGDAKLAFDRNPRNGIVGRIQPGLTRSGQSSLVYAPIPESDQIRYADGRGTGLLAEQLYWTFLETGLRLTPTAGSGFCRSDTHLGYNRTYVHHKEPVEESSYWQGVLEGRTFVTNGPLLRVSVNELPPGAIFYGRSGEAIELQINASLSVRDPVDYLDVIFCGDTLYSAKLEEHYQRGEFPLLKIEKSGWLVVRVVTSRENVYRYASTAPYYFEFDQKPRVSKRAVQFMQTWLASTEQAIRSNREENSLYDELLAKAHRYWNDRLEKVNAP